MQNLTATDYNKLRDGGRVIEADGFGDKVIRLKDGDFLKLFRRKKWLSSDLIVPTAVRFARNADELIRRGIPTIDMVSVYKIPSVERMAVHYHPLVGDTLRDWLKQADTMERDQLARDLGRFIARLHRSGIYFRSLHLGNIVKMPDGRLGLIDIADMRCSGRALSRDRRLRNFRHLARYRDDMALLGQSAAILAESYNEIAGTRDGFRQQLDNILDGK